MLSMDEAKGRKTEPRLDTQNKFSDVPEVDELQVQKKPAKKQLHKHDGKAHPTSLSLCISCCDKTITATHSTANRAVRSQYTVIVPQRWICFSFLLPFSKQNISLRKAKPSLDMELDVSRDRRSGLTKGKQSFGFSGHEAVLRDVWKHFFGGYFNYLNS